MIADKAGGHQSSVLHERTLPDPTPESFASLSSEEIEVTRAHNESANAANMYIVLGPRLSEKSVNREGVIPPSMYVLMVRLDG